MMLPQRCSKFAFRETVGEEQDGSARTEMQIFCIRVSKSLTGKAGTVEGERTHCGLNWTKRGRISTN